MHICHNVYRTKSPCTLYTVYHKGYDLKQTQNVKFSVGITIHHGNYQLSMTNDDTMMTTTCKLIIWTIIISIAARDRWTIKQHIPYEIHLTTSEMLYFHPRVLNSGKGEVRGRSAVRSFWSDGSGAAICMCSPGTGKTQETQQVRKLMCYIYASYTHIHVNNATTSYRPIPIYHTKLSLKQVRYWNTPSIYIYINNSNSVGNYATNNGANERN